MLRPHQGVGIPLADLEEIELDQNERLIKVVQSPVGETKILVAAFDGVEELSVLTRFSLEIMTLGRALKPSEMLGQKLAVAIATDNDSRQFSGIVSSMQVARSMCAIIFCIWSNWSRQFGSSHSTNAVSCSTT